MDDLTSPMASLDVANKALGTESPPALDNLAEWTEYTATKPQTSELPVSAIHDLRCPDTLGTAIEVRNTEAKGLGVFALRDIEPRTVLLCEAPIVTLIDTGSRADPLDLVVDALSPERKASFLSLHAYSRNKSESLNRSIVYSNGYSIHNDLATGVFETASRINHSCVPNSQYVWKGHIGRMIFWNHRKLLAGEEVTVDYGHKRNYLKKIYGFECMCGGCKDSGSDVVSPSGCDGEVKGMSTISEVVTDQVVLANVKEKE